MKDDIIKQQQHKIKWLTESLEAYKEMIELRASMHDTANNLYDMLQADYKEAKARADKYQGLHNMTHLILDEMVKQLDEALDERDRARDTAARYIEQSMACGCDASV